MEDLAQSSTPEPSPEEQPSEAAAKAVEQTATETSATTPQPNHETPTSGKTEAKTEQPEAAKAVPKPAAPRMADLRPGMVLEGTVTRIEKYGAFVNLGLADRRDGLIHISELAPNRIRRVEDVVRVGAPVRARVVSVDMGRGRISLSLNDVDEVEQVSEAVSAPSEPVLTGMALAFQQAYASKREREDQQGSHAPREDDGSKKKREQESLMHRFRST